MMECDEIIEHIDAAEYGIKAFGELRGHKHKKPSALSVAAFAFAQMTSDREPASFAEECQGLFQLVYWVEELRKGNDPRCNLCKQNDKLNAGLKIHGDMLQ